MPIFNLFFSFLIAAITGIVLTSIYSVNGIAPAWINDVFLAIIAAGVMSSIFTKDVVCHLCSFIPVKSLHICHCKIA